MAKDPMVSISESELESARFMPIQFWGVNANIGKPVKNKRLAEKQGWQV